MGQVIESIPAVGRIEPLDEHTLGIERFDHLGGVAAFEYGIGQRGGSTLR